jgi:hypothetical protein
MNDIINSNLLWWICSISVMVVAAQAGAFYRLSRKNASAMGVPIEHCNKAFKTGLITAIGPALSILIVLVGLMAVLGNPLSWMRGTMIVSAANNLTAARIGADAAGVTFGGADYGSTALFVSWFGIAINGVGSMLGFLIFSGRLETIRTKLVSKNPKILALVSGAAMAAIYGNLSSAELKNGGPNLVAWMVAGITMLVLYKVSQRFTKLKEYNLGIAMILGTVAGALAHSVMA